MTEPPEAPDRVTEQKQGDRGARRLPAGLLAIVVIASMAVLSYGLVRIYPGIGVERAFGRTPGAGRGTSRPKCRDQIEANEAERPRAPTPWM